MSDFTSITLGVNTGTSDASPTWTNISFGTAGYELRAALTGGAQTTSTASTAWPSIVKPGSGSTLITALYAFTADTTGYLITGGDGTGSHYNVFRINWDATGTMGSAPIISAYANNTYPAASPGTQGTGDGNAVINGTSTESSSKSLLKASVYGNGVTAAGAADVPSANMGSNPTVGTGTTGAVTTVNATWTAWQDLQAGTDWIVNGAVPKAVTVGAWNFLLAMYIAASQTGGTLLPVLTFNYTWI